MSTASNPQPRLTEAQIDRAIAAATAGHRMAGMEPTAADIAIGRRQLRGENHRRRSRRTCPRRSIERTQGAAPMTGTQIRLSRHRRFR